MPRRPRVSTAGLYFHVVNRSAKRVRLFDSSADYDAFERVLGLAVTRREISLFAYCVMPNHWHLLLSPRIDGELSRFMHWLTTTHARRWQTGRELDGEGAVYQGRFKAIPVCDDRHFLWVCRYVERNPVRAGLVESAGDWVWSSAGSIEAPRDVVMLAPWPVGRPANWSTHVDEPQTEVELDAFRRAMASGRPFGDEMWCQSIEQRLGCPDGRRRAKRHKLVSADVLQE